MRRFGHRPGSAAQFGGGGHRRAAGAELQLRLDQAIPTVLEAAREVAKHR